MQSRQQQAAPRQEQPQPPPPEGARMCHLWFRTLPDVVRFIADRESAEAAEAAWRRYAADPGVLREAMLDLDSYPDGNGRRMRLMARCADMVCLAVDRLTVFAAAGLPQGPSSPVPGAS